MGELTMGVEEDILKHGKLNRLNKIYPQAFHFKHQILWVFDLQWKVNFNLVMGETGKKKTNPSFTTHKQMCNYHVVAAEESEMLLQTRNREVKISWTVPNTN